MRQGDSNQQSNYAGCLSNEPAYNYSPNVTTTNQITASPYTYDKAGNVLTAPFGSGTNTFTYDAENHLLTVNPGGITYTYDGDGKRIIKSTGTIYWYGNNAAPMAETTLSDSLLFRDFYFNSERVARQEIDNWVDNFVYDHLGNTRYFLGNINAVGGTPYNNISDFFPFGGELIIQAPDPQPWKFTGKERDSESGLDNFGARYDSSNMGRFMSPDWSSVPVPVPFSDLANPQSLNLYSYVGNNPLNRTDAFGHCWSWLQGLCNVVQQVYYGVFTDYGFQTHAQVKEIRKQETAARRLFLTNNNVVTPDKNGNTIDWSTASDKQVNNSFNNLQNTASGAMLFKLLHDPDVIRNNPRIDAIRQMSTQDIIKDLQSGAEPLVVKPDGTVMNGNTRLLVLEERGIDIDGLGLKPQIYNTSPPLEPWEDLPTNPTEKPPDNE
jgi:RHS repeat-associated protein